MELVAEVDRRHLYLETAYESTEAWVAGYLGRGFMKATEYVRIAVAVSEFPLLKQAYLGGVFSYDHLRGLAQVITKDNQHEVIAKFRELSVADTFRLVDKMKTLDSLDSKLARSERYLEMSWDKDSRMLLLKGALPEETGAKVERAIDRLARRLPDDDGEVFSPMGAERADALCQLAGAVLTKEAPRATVVVHVDEKSLMTGEGSAEIVGGPAVAPEAARRMLCDGRFLVAVDLPDRSYIEVDRTTSTLTNGKRRQVHERDRRCRVKGCLRKKLVQVHHIDYESRGGGHNLSNLVLLCEHHHWCVHEGGYTIKGTPPNIWLEHPNRPAVKGGPPRAPT